MDYVYLAYNNDRKLVKGKIAAFSEKEATSLLSRVGYQVVNIRAETHFFDLAKILTRFSSVNTRDIILLSRQLALLIQSGINVVTALELLSSQMTNRTMKEATADIIKELKDGSSLGAAFSRHPKIFPPMYCRAIAAGEKGGNLDAIMKQMTDFMENTLGTQKKIKGALAYPALVLGLSVVVIIVLVTFVLPSFVTLFDSFGTKLPAATQALINIVNWFSSYGLYVLVLVIALMLGGYFYTRTRAGRRNLDRLVLKLPVMGRIVLLNELSYCCRLMSILFKVGLTLPDIMTLAVQSASNSVISDALSGVRDELIRGEGLSKPMSRRQVFQPLMVQMISVGEETGHLDVVLNTVAESYEIDAADRTKVAIGLIQPALTIVIGGVIAFVAISLVQAMYGVYGSIGN